MRLSLGKVQKAHPVKGRHIMTPTSNMIPDSLTH